jgi:hypothetical protein
MVDFKNESSNKFEDIQQETYRTYVYFKEGVQVPIRIEQPLKLSISSNGHRVFDASGKSHYMPKGWIHLFWEVEKGSANFVK